MEGIISLDNVFEEEDQAFETRSYTVGSRSLLLKTNSMHVGVSRSVWKASLVLCALLNDDQSLATLKEDKDLLILELGSGPGLAGLFCGQTFAGKVLMTDICPKSLALAK